METLHDIDIWLCRLILDGNLWHFDDYAADCFEDKELAARLQSEHDKAVSIIEREYGSQPHDLASSRLFDDPFWLSILHGPCFRFDASGPAYLIDEDKGVVYAVSYYQARAFYSIFEGEDIEHSEMQRLYALGKPIQL